MLAFPRRSRQTRQRIRAPGGRARLRFGLPVFFVRNCLLRRQRREGRHGFLFALTTAYNRWPHCAMLCERRREARDDRQDSDRL